MYTVLIILFVLVCALLTFVILIQSSKGGGLAGSFGGMDTMGTLFGGGRGSAPFLQKVTAVLATLFLIIALIMGFMTRGGVSTQSLVERERDRLNSSPARTLPQVPDQTPAPSPNK
ncbi:MAG TPA: preprotein translocase subunit SecG [bacterium]|mgnify:FL=1|nr:preprotein translocase subunit SecG [bacterium]HPR87378.1 preprotein translocase subunit SecG [bacterium]